MTMLQRLRLSPRWLVVLVALAAVLVATASLTPHDETEDANCLVCKAGHQPLQHRAPATEPEAGAARSSSVPKESTAKVRTIVVDFSSPRAPPA